MRGAATSLLMLLLGAGAHALSQDQSSASVAVRLVVTDARGRPVDGLSAADIEISEGPRQHKIESFVRVARGARTFGILFDDYHVSAGPASEKARSALVAFLEREVRGDDRVFIMRPLDPPSGLAPVSSRERLRELVAGFDGRKGNYTSQNAFEAEYMSSVPPAAARHRAQVSRAAMQALVLAVQKSPGSDAKAVLVLTEGFSAEERSRYRMTSLRTIARAARMTNVPVYVFDPSPAPQAAIDESWQSLADETGGLLTPGGSPLEAALARMAADLDHHFVVTIAGPVKEDGAYHVLAVTAKRRDVTVRAPKGFWAPIAAERYTPALRPAMSTYLKTPHISGVIQPWFRMERGEGGETHVVFSWTPRRGRGAPARVVLSAVTFEGVQLHESPVAAHGTKEEATRATFNAPAGPIQVAMEISDAAGKLIDTEVRYINVPNLDASTTTITAIELLRTRTVRQFVEQQAQADVMPSDTREFQRQDRLIVRVRTATVADKPVVRARLLNALGQPMRELPALPPVDGVPQFDLPLAPYARGDYRIEINVGAGEASVTQLVPFRLLG